MKTLVVYFTLTGKTRNIAQIIAKELQADIEEIIPEKPYQKVDLKKMSMPVLKMFIEAAFHRQPEIRPVKHSINDYDLIIICSPVWANNIASPVNTFLNQQAFRYKNISIVITADRGQSTEKIFLNLRHKLYSQQATVIQEAIIPAESSKKEEYLSATHKLTSKLEPLTKIRLT